MALALLAAGCAPTMSETDRACPCAAGWICCESTPVCVARASQCPPRGWGDEVHLSASPAYCLGSVEGEESEGGWTLAVRLTPPLFPFSAERVVYRVPADPGQGCAPGAAHTIRLFAGAATPAESPEIARTMSVEAVEQDAERLLEIPVDPPFVVAEGDVYVALTQASAPRPRLCFPLCPLGEPHRTWLSKSSDPPPYRWQSVPGADQNLSLRLVGRTRLP